MKRKDNEWILAGYQSNAPLMICSTSEENAAGQQEDEMLLLASRQQKMLPAMVSCGAPTLRHAASVGSVELELNQDPSAQLLSVYRKQRGRIGSVSSFRDGQIRNARGSTSQGWRHSSAAPPAAWGAPFIF